MRARSIPSGSAGGIAVLVPGGATAAATKAQAAGQQQDQDDDEQDREYGHLPGLG